MATRIIVKNIPTYATNERLRDVFGKYGAITDLKIAKTPDGKSRKFAFIGYLDKASALKAIKYNDSTYMDTTKISVVLARCATDDAIPRPWSRYSKGSSAFELSEQRKNDRIRSKEEKQQRRSMSLFDDNQSENLTPNTPVLPPENNKNDRIKSLSEIYGKKALLENDEGLLEYLLLNDKKTTQLKWKNDDYVAASLIEAAANATKNPETPAIDHKRLLKPPKTKVKVDVVGAKRPSVKGLTHTRTHVTFEDSDTSDEDAYQTLNFGPGHHLSEPDQNITDDDLAPTKASKEKKTSPDLKKNTIDPKKTSADPKKTSQNLQVSDVDYFKQKMVGSDLSDFESSGFDTCDFEGDSDSDASVQDTKKVDFSVLECENGRGEEKSWLETKKTTLKKGQPRDKPPTPDVQLRVIDHKQMVSIADSGAIYVRNLPYLCKEEDLEAAFNVFGPLSEINMPLDKETKQCKGYASIYFIFPKHALEAFSAMDGKVFMGRLIHLMPAKQPPKPASVENSSNSLEHGSDPVSYKKELEKKQKASAMETSNWNSLFMRSDTLLEAVAEKLNLKKSDILSKEASGSMAVKMALSETHVLQETKTYFEEHGINIESFKFGPGFAADKSGKTIKRSKTAIIVKNLPFAIDSSTLAELFGNYGLVDKVVLPPTKTIAIVNFIEPLDARNAFKKLAYSKFKNVPLFLEFAPANIFLEKTFDNPTSTTNRAPLEGGSKPGESNTGEFNAGAADQQSIDDEEAGLFEDADCTIFVKNISFNTTESDFKAAFEPAGEIRSAHISMRKDPKNPGKLLSMGYGFIQYKYSEGAQKAMRTLQNTVLDGHNLDLKLSIKKLVSGSTKSEKKSATNSKKSHKLMIRNIAFEANKQELKELMSSVGVVKSIRLPTKLDGSIRGFGFVEFATQKEAEAAKAALEATHFYGRHLVIEYALGEGSLEELQASTKKKALDDASLSSVSSKKKKITINQ